MRNFKDGSFVIGIDPVGFCTDQVHMGMYINPTGGVVTFSIVQGKMDTDSINGYLLMEAWNDGGSTGLGISEKCWY